MVHKVHPKVFRIREATDWNSRGFHKNPAKFLEEDFEIRKFLDKKLGKIGIEKVEIERFPNKVNVIISSARPGLIIGRGGEGIEKLKKELDNALPLLETGKREIRLEIREIRDPWFSAKLSSQWIAQRIENRTPCRRVLKQALSKIVAHKEVKGARVEIAGRLNGSEHARREWLASGRLPRQTIRADIDYARSIAYCSYGVIGVKVWIYKGEKF